MPPQTISLADMNWISQREEWISSRSLPHFLTHEVVEWTIAGDDAPSPAQELALQNFLRDEERIGKSLQEALLRCLTLARKRAPDWFGDSPAIRSANQLSQVLDLQCVKVLRQEHDGEAIIGLGFSCDWDPEHGFGVAVYRGHLVDAGPFECCFMPFGQGLPPEAMEPDQKAAWQAIFGDEIAKQQADQEALVAKHQEMQRQSLRSAANNPESGPALREFSRLVAEHPDYALTFCLDVPQPAPQVSGSAAEALQMLTQGMPSGPLAQVFDPFKNMVSLSTQPPIPVVELTLQLPGYFAMWNYTGQIRTERLEGGEWPGILRAIVTKWPEAKPRFESITIFKYDSKFGRKPDRKSPLQSAAVAAIGELWGVEVPTVTSSSPLDDLRGGSEGVARWNRRSDTERSLGGPYKKADLRGAVLDGANLAGLDLQKSCFDEARITGGSIKTSNLNQSTFRRALLSEVDTTSAKLKKCDFTEADLRGVNLTIADCTGANFDRADLRGANFTDCKLRGANLSTANLEGTTFFLTEFDDQTKFPENFTWPNKM